MLAPQKVKYRKPQKGRMKGMAIRGSHVSFGTFGLKALEPGWITSRQIEAARRTITRHARRGGQVWIRIFPDKPVSKKPLEVRMGSGKAATDQWVAVVKRGRILFEVGGIREDVAIEALRLASHKLPTGTRVITRENI